LLAFVALKTTHAHGSACMHAPFVCIDVSKYVWSILSGVPVCLDLMDVLVLVSATLSVSFMFVSFGVLVQTRQGEKTAGERPPAEGGHEAPETGVVSVELPWCRVVDSINQAYYAS